MKIYVTTHGNYEDNHISLVTTDFDLAIRHFLDYSKEDPYWNSMSNIKVWENNKQLFDYGSMNYDIINQKKPEKLTYDDIRNDILKQFKNLL